MLTLAVAGVFVVGGVAGAAIPDSDDDEIHACHQKNQGQLRVIDAEDGDECRPSERPLAWNQEGPQGEVGPRGPSDAFSRFHDGEQAISDSGFGTLLELDVPDGKYAVTATIITRNAGAGPARLVTCRTLLPSGDFDIARARVEPPGGADIQTLTMNPVGFSNGPGTITLDCSDGGGDVRGSWAKITATQVENLTNTPG
ncbi:MAG: hypothetical protein WD844_01465 [Thermoleophilaceae bacterium]